MAYDKTALKALITLSAAEVVTIRAAAGSRDMQWFRALWPYGVTTSTGDPTVATMAQAYDLSLATDAQLEDVLDAVGPRTSNLNILTVAAAGV